MNARVQKQLGGFRVVAECHAANAERGGDFYCASPGKQGRLAVVIGDACGHGAEGAKVLGTLLPAVRSFVDYGMGPARLLTELNRRVCSELPDDRFVTAAAFELDSDAGWIEASNAGHVPALIRRANGGVSLVGRASGPALGLVSGAKYEEERVPLYQGDLIVFMTDGIVEAIENDLVDMRHLRQLIQLAPDGRVHSSVGRVLRDVERSTDDRTLISIEVTARPHSRESS
jgi:serine phosphatase RsbU (regulator of sigma subunit)